MSIAPQPRKKNGQFGKLPKKLAKLASKSKVSKVLVSPKIVKPESEIISPKLKRYINERIRHQNDYILECLHIFLMDLEGALERDQLDWED
jgi:hypothetical protein